MRKTILVLVGLSAILALALIVPRVVGQAGGSYRGVRSDVASIASLLDRFRLDCGRYPTQTEGLGALTQEPIGLMGKWKGPYSRRTPELDPWKHPYLYTRAGKGYTLVSLGADGEPGGEGEDADIREEG